MLPGQGRHRRVQGDPRRVRRPDRDAHRQGRHRRRRGRAWSPAPTTTSSSRSSPRSWSPGSGPGYAASTRPAQETLTIGDLTIDVAGHAVTRDGDPISLTPLEFDLLVCLARKPWQVFTREVLLEQVWGYRHAADTRLVNVHVQRLRSKVEHDPENPEIVVTVRGVGYKAGSTGSMSPPWCTTVAPDWPRAASREALRRGLTFWRRSIQARVVVSTVLLSAVVVSVVGWFLLRQTQRRPARPPRRRGRAPRRQRDHRGPRPARRPRPAPTPTPPPRQRDLVEPIIQRGATRGFSVVLAGPGRRTAAGSPTAARSPRRGSTSPASRPRWRSTSTTSTPPAWTYTDDPQHRRRGARSAPTPGIVVGSQVKLPADGATYTLYYLFPLDERAGDARAGDPGAAHRRRAAAGAGRRPDLAGDPAGRDADPDGPPGRRAAGRRAAPGAAPGHRRGRPGPPGDVVQPDGDATCSARSGSSRSSAGCSAGSSPTSPTSCARR